MLYNLTGILADRQMETMNVAFCDNSNLSECIKEVKHRN